MRTTDMTPTWGEIGLLTWRLIVSQEIRALQAYRSEIARAFAMAEALNRLSAQLSEAQREERDRIIGAEMRKQGVSA
ncbi:hypothetical protein [Xenophilus azovorans]|uniref:hypothetical protein n=1 Tax=Xenophilus azovorans TaxID=151755 RepID=UPI00068B2E49|nr:hypothetical protein [Xenophilus azovorans]